MTNLDAPNSSQQPSPCQPYHHLEYEAERFLRHLTDPGRGPPYKNSPFGILIVGDVPSRAPIDSAGLGYTGTGYNDQFLFKHQDSGRRAAKIKQSFNRQTPRIMHMRLRIVMSHPAWVPLRILSAIIRCVYDTRSHSRSHLRTTSSKRIVVESIGLQVLRIVCRE